MKLLLQTLVTVFFLGFLFGWMSQAKGAEIILKKSVNPTGNIIKLGDVAKIRSSDITRSHRLAQLPIMPAPTSGTTRFISRRQIDELLIAHGENLSEHLILGPNQIRIGMTTSPRGRSSRRLDSVAKRKIEKTINSSVLKHIRTYSRKDLPFKVELKLSSLQIEKLSVANTPVMVSGGKEPWKGMQNFILSFHSQNGPHRLSVQAAVSLPKTALVAKYTLPRGSIVAASDIEFRYMDKGYRKLSSTIDKPEMVIGKETTTQLQAGRPITMSQLRHPILVKRGEVVSVIARSGGITVKTEAVSQGLGSKGDIIIVETVAGKRRLTARVAGPQQVEVFAKSTSTTSYRRERIEPRAPQPFHSNRQFITPINARKGYPNVRRVYPQPIDSQPQAERVATK